VNSQTFFWSREGSSLWYFWCQVWGREIKSLKVEEENFPKCEMKDWLFEDELGFLVKNLSAL
jgi:hypothetical protein